MALLPLLLPLLPEAALNSVWTLSANKIPECFHSSHQEPLSLLDTSTFPTLTFKAVQTTERGKKKITVFDLKADHLNFHAIKIVEM